MKQNRRIRKKWAKAKGCYVNPKETWALDQNIAKYVLPRLKLFKKVSITYPGIGDMDTPEKWDEALDKMIFAFDRLVQENFGLSKESYLEEWKEVHPKIEEGLSLFAKWFTYLNW